MWSFVKIVRLKPDFKVSDDVASGRASWMIYTPCLGTKGSAQTKTSGRRCGEYGAWEANCFPGKLPMGTVPRAMRTQCFCHSPGFYDEPRRVDCTFRTFMSQEHAKENFATSFEVFIRCYVRGWLDAGVTDFACRCRLSRLSRPSSNILTSDSNCHMRVASPPFDVHGTV